VTRRSWLRRLTAEDVPFETWARSLRQGRRLLWCLIYGAMLVEAAYYAQMRPVLGQALLPGLVSQPATTVSRVAADPAEAKRLADLIHRQWGVEIHWRDAAHFQDWPPALQPKDWAVLPIADADLVPALKLVIEALSVYPPGFVRETMGPLVLCGGLKIGADPVGGMTYVSTIYIVASDLADPSMRLFARDTVHHEFSTLALSKAPLDDKAWLAANPPGFAYAIDTDSNAKMEATQLTDEPARLPALHEQGFMSRYGQASVRNDFNTYADAAFGHPADLVALMLQYPRIRRKAALFAGVYEALDPAFRAYFDRAGITAAMGS
jgi:hypothetical protein